MWKIYDHMRDFLSERKYQIYEHYYAPSQSIKEIWKGIIILGHDLSLTYNKNGWKETLTE